MEINLKKPKKLKKNSVSYLKKKADMLFSLQVREVGECQIAGLDTVRCNGNLQCMHIIGRANMRLRYDRKNALCGCAGHHMYYTQHPWEWVELVQAVWPETYAYINEVRNEKVKTDYETLLKELE